MVALSLPETIANFEGRISHVVVAGSETLTFIKLSKWHEERKKITAKLHRLSSSLQKLTSLSAVKSGEVYIVNVDGSLERAYVIRRPTPDTYSIYLIDKGMQCETQFDDIYELPPEILEFGLFNCVCPVFVPSSNQLSIYKAFVGHRCRCEVESVSRSVVVFGYVRGRLMVKNGDAYEDLQDIVYGRSAKRLNDFGRQTDARFYGEPNIATAGTLFIQTAFKQYEPDTVPVTIAVRFDKTDRMFSTFWVVNKEVFSTVERILKENAVRLSHFPLLQRTGENVQMRQTPCIVCTRTDNIHRAFYRAVPAHFDSRTKRYSIFLVDFGWFKWVLANDIIDISSMDKSDPIRDLPVALIHCRENATSTLHVKDLSKGDDCEIRIKGFRNRDVFPVDLLESGSGATNDQQFSTAAEQSNSRVNRVSKVLETEVIASCRKMVTETCQRQLMTSMMMETLSIARRDLIAQPQCFWQNYYSSLFPMPWMMPVALPMMMPIPFPSTNPQDANNNAVLKPDNTPVRNLESTSTRQSNESMRQNSPDNYHNQSASFQEGSSQHTSRVWYRSDFNERSRFGAAFDDKNSEQISRTSHDANNDGLSWEQASMFAKTYRSSRSNFDGNSQEVRLTSWEKAVAVDRAVRKQRNACGGRASSSNT